MQVGPAEIALILFVALLVFGPQRLPEVGRQVGAAVRELRRMQESVRGELDMVLHPEHGTSSSGIPDAELEPGDHIAVNDADPTPEIESGSPSSNGTTASDASDDDGRFLGPPDSFI